MATDLRPGVRAGLGVGGLVLVAVGVLLAFRGASDLTSLGALIVGAVLGVAAISGRLPNEVGLQRVTFGAQDRSAQTYREALYGAVREALPELSPPSRDKDWHPRRPTYWVDELQLRVVIRWAPDRSVHLDVSTVESDVVGTRDAVAVLLVTNVDEVDDLQSAVRSTIGERAAVVRWRSTDDNAALRRVARGLGAPKGPPQ
ncbi:hypothetical protein ACIBL3_39860 [Kribbella sp. NPDC050124]|uniref:hypothetical protein n=1 Tax=Kribbella sp. NPDC050124 TaxID=3364114 RepID=UPI0037984D3B